MEENKNNSGDKNAGDNNPGDKNSGNSNSGDNNSGDSNSGNRNSGYGNSGNYNSGDRNSGNWNSGDSNSGYGNSGYCDSGNYNSGYRNSGNSNSGDWNSGDKNSGCFNIDTPKLRIFGKETELKREDINFPNWVYFDLTEWIPYDNMTKQEKEENSFAEFTGGYLKTYEYKKAFKNSFEKADLGDLRLTLELPNFNYEIFEEISGISEEDFNKRLNNKDIKIYEKLIDDKLLLIKKVLLKSFDVGEIKSLSLHGMNEFQTKFTRVKKNDLLKIQLVFNGEQFSRVKGIPIKTNQWRIQPVILNVWKDKPREDEK